MEPIKILKEEHRLIERVLASLEVAARRLAAGEPIRAGFFIDAATFIQGFADDCHHRKEEGGLFPALEKAGIPKEGGPIGVMLAEHEQGRWLTRAMRQAAEQMQSGAATAHEQIVRNAQDYAALLQQHIWKEENVLFPTADNVVPEEEQARMSAAFERIEHEELGAGTHEKYAGMVEALEREAGA